MVEGGGRGVKMRGVGQETKLRVETGKISAEWLCTVRSRYENAVVWG